MSEQVPEGGLSRDDQMKLLHERLLGHEAFGQCRGTLSPLKSIYDDLLKRAQSPTHFCQLWDEFSARARAVGNILAQLKRDGHNHAAEELFLALRQPGYLLPGETVPLHETKPFTLVIVDPYRTFMMIRWILQEHWMNLNAFLDNPEGKRWQHSLTRQLFFQFPSLRPLSIERRRRGGYEGPDLIQAHNKDVLSRFFLDHESWTHPAIETNPLRRLKFQTLGIQFGQYNDHLELQGQRFAFLFEAEQNEVLSCFSRAEQRHRRMIASWQLHIPIALEEFNIGLHPEEEHTHWSGESPALISRGASFGFGAVTLHPAKSTHLTFHQGGCRENAPFRFVLWNRG